MSVIIMMNRSRWKLQRRVFAAVLEHFRRRRAFAHATAWASSCLMPAHLAALDAIIGPTVQTGARRLPSRQQTVNLEHDDGLGQGSVT